MKIITTFILISLLSIQMMYGQNTKAVENIKPTTSQKERRERSETICQSKGIPVYKNKNALFINSDEAITLRTKDEVVDRVFALLYLALKSEGLEEAHLKNLEQMYSVEEKLTPNELLYFNADNPTEQQRVNANWKYECMHVMLWSLGYIEDLHFPSEVCNVADDVGIIVKKGPKKFREDAELRNKEEILDKADLILRYDWACVSARVKGEKAPANLDAGVVYEWHYALNWLIQYANQNWDNVTTDT
ncbi:DUF4272 domain-containing protein [Flammeovirga sp. SJP92]|uniref:DUF4272 domain-containing protein n=1 Tax=Flammeovirga sp. SJP92 TaxID=1775430 RepID=UPI000788339C|nr:DUF4272 domain-containing protein [Flammeovirga sp. SJP92]KXX71246.1 hypothetical protein AVL50_09320 [Flammeovirga sp. SJP92]